MKHILQITLLGSLVLFPAMAQINLSGLAVLESKAKEMVNVTLDGTMLQLATRFLSTKSKGNDTKAADLLKELKSISVRFFEFSREGQHKPEDLQPIRAQLREPVWKKMISTSGGSEMVEIYTKTEQGKITGLTVISSESRELTIVAIEGAIDLAAIASLSGTLGIPDLSLDQLLNKGKSK